MKRKFVKTTSVFKDWNEDTKEILSKVLELDSERWKISRLIKD